MRLAEKKHHQLAGMKITMTMIIMIAISSRIKKLEYQGVCGFRSGVGSGWSGCWGTGFGIGW